MDPGTRIGPYEVVAPIGAGGMGEVYRAVDTKLRRDVAIKVLPPDLAGDGERLARLEREAQVLASLNHPHIAAIYGLERSEAGPCLILEYVAGETIDERLRRGVFSVEEALEIARQVASALEAAHEKGIVHRDLKPANIKLTPEGVAKVLDFGLAKAFADESGSADPSLSPTMTAVATQAGVILGTAAYMSPEQARGRSVDKRADIWTFGVVLYEMLTGRRLFRGETVSELLASVIKDEPDLEPLPRELPAAARHLIARCLTRDPGRRLRDIGEARIVLETPAEASDPSDAATAAGGSRRSHGWLRVLAGALAGGALVAAAWVLFSGTHPAPGMVRSRIDAPEGAAFRLQADFGGAPRVSPDGRRLAFVAVSSDRQSRLWVRPLDSLVAREVPGTEGAYAPFWSADGRSLGFFAEGTLKRVDLEGGSVMVLARVTQGKGGTWSAGDVVLYAPNFNSPILAIPATGGDPRPVTTLGAGETTHRWPQFLPDGEHFLYFGGSHDDLRSKDRGIYVGSLSTGETWFLLASEANGIYSAGHLLSVRDGSLVAYPFDPDQGVLEGPPRGLGDPVNVDTSTWRINLGASWDGTVVYQRAGEVERDMLMWVDREGEEIGTVEAQGSHVSLRLSPDARHLATETQISPNSDIWIHDLERQTSFKLTLSPTDEGRATWSPDGRRVAFQSNQGDGIYRLYERPADGSRPEQPIPGGDGRAERDGRNQDLWPTDWSGDGRHLLIVEGVYGDIGTRRSLSVIDLEEGVRRLLITSEANISGRFSPDGRWVAFGLQIDGEENVFVAPFDADRVARVDPERPALEGEPRWQISFQGGNRPVWRGDGRELYYLRPDNSVMAVALDAEGDSLHVGATSALFVVPMRLSDYVYDAAPDGRRFLVSMQGAGTQAPLVLLTGWTQRVAEE